MDKYKYEPLNLGRPAIRLLRLHRGGSSKISCELFQAELHQRDDTVSYEALSYTWGSLDLNETIIINGCSLEITSQLYIALQHLRNQDEDRVLWIDAVCIDQRNKKERGHQVEQMSKIYKEADRVIFWLGSGTFATDVLMESLQLLQLESIRHASRDWSLKDDRWKHMWDFMESSFEKSHTDFKKLQRRGLQELLSRPWFRRVWILQEVALANAGIVSCGTKSVSARLFGLIPLLLEITPDTHCQSVLDIMPSPWRKSSWWSKNQNLRTLLLSFGDSEATESRDLVYALRGMSSDAKKTTTLLPDYEKPEEYLIRDVVLFVEFCELETLGFAASPLTIRDLIKCLRDLDLNRCMALAENSLPRDLEMLLIRPEVRVNQEIINTAVARDQTGEVVEVLLRHREKEFTASENILISAAKNPSGAKGIFEVLFRYHGDQLVISDEVLKTAAENLRCGDEVLKVLLRHQPDRRIVAQKVLIYAARNQGCGDRVVDLLLSYKGDRLIILEEFLLAAAENEACGDKVMYILLRYRWGRPVISEKVLMAAMNNRGCGDKVLNFLESYRQGQLQRRVRMTNTKN